VILRAGLFPAFKSSFDLAISSFFVVSTHGSSAGKTEAPRRPHNPLQLYPFQRQYLLVPQSMTVDPPGKQTQRWRFSRHFSPLMRPPALMPRFNDRRVSSRFSRCRVAFFILPFWPSKKFPFPSRAKISLLSPDPILPLLLSTPVSSVSLLLTSVSLC